MPQKMSFLQVGLATVDTTQRHAALGFTPPFPLFSPLSLCHRLLLHRPNVCRVSTTLFHEMQPLIYGRPSLCFNYHLYLCSVDGGIWITGRTTALVRNRTKYNVNLSGDNVHQRKLVLLLKISSMEYVMQIGLP